MHVSTFNPLHALLRACVTGLGVATVAVVLASSQAWAQKPAAPTGEIRIAHILSKTGPLEAYGKQKIGRASCRERV